MIRKSQRNRRKPEVFVPGNGVLEAVNEERSDVSNYDGDVGVEVCGNRIWLVCAVILGTEQASSEAEEAEDGYEEEDGEEESKRVGDGSDVVVDAVCLCVVLWSDWLYFVCGWQLRIGTASRRRLG